jgi:hypothetical protein
MMSIRLHRSRDTRPVQYLTDKFQSLLLRIRKSRFAITFRTIGNALACLKYKENIENCPIKMSNSSAQYAQASPHAVHISDTACETARSSHIFLPAPPSKFSKSKSGSRSQTCKPFLAQSSPSEQDFIQSIRRSTCQDVYSSDICPVGSAHSEEDLWAAFDHIFL